MQNYFFMNDLSSLFHPASLIFFCVYVFIVLRSLRRTSLPIWAIMFFGAIAMLFLNGISINAAYGAINLDVIFFLIGMFSIVSGLETSGLLKYLTVRILYFAGSPNRAMLFILGVLGILSAFLMNDTIAIAATPLIIGLAREMKIKPTPFLITLAFSVSIGSTMTSIGNPQNFLIAIESGLKSPFFDFLIFLGPPTIINLFVTYFIVKLYYKKDLAMVIKPSDFKAVNVKEMLSDHNLAKLTGVVTIITITFFFLISIIKLLGYETNLNLGTVSLFGASIIYIFSPRRIEVIRNINWNIILFFISMFIVMEAVWRTGIVTEIISTLPQINHSHSPLNIINILFVSVLLSQFMSNVPFVAVFIDMMKSIGFSGLDVKGWMALAGGSTLAGNLTILGAASTIIILESAEKHGITFGFLEYLKIGFFVTIANISVLALWLILI